MSNHKVTYKEKELDSLAVQSCKVADRVLQSPRYGSEPGPWTLWQGGYGGNHLARSAGTHNGGAVIDMSSFNYEHREILMRCLGWAIWKRWPAQGFPDGELHGVLMGDTTASPEAKEQQVAYAAGRNGLANNGKDDGFKLPGNVKPRWVDSTTTQGKPGTFVAKRNASAWQYPTTKSKPTHKIIKGQKVTILGIVRNGSARWGITPSGVWVRIAVLKHK